MNPILVLNSGSSSIKFALYPGNDDGAWPPAPALWSGKVEAITGDDPLWSETGRTTQSVALDPAAPYASALSLIMRRVHKKLGDTPLGAVAHRVVHGGSKYFASIRLSNEVLSDLRTYIPLAPLHQPYAIDGINRLLSEYPSLPQVACFDTAFHRTLPKVEQQLPLPAAAWDRGIRRYGFHGLSYEYMATALDRRHGDAARGRTLVAHLGSGASLCGMVNLQSTATTMGFSALDGLMMGTRPGALDPGALLYLMEVEKLSLAKVGQILYRESGLLGVSGRSSDPRELLLHEADDSQCHDALALYVHRIVRETGAITAFLGGLDMLVFTAGVGENNPTIRARICDKLAFLGIRLDADANESNQPIISAPDSSILVAVERTNEEWVAARSAREVLASAA